jgi:hypothetical protein
MTKLVLCAGLLLSMAITRMSQAQQVTALAADTAGHNIFTYAKGTDRYYLGTLTKADGTQLSAYLPTQRIGYKGRFSYFLPPLSIANELRHRRSINVKKVKQMEVRGHSYEAVLLNGKPIDVLAVKLLEGPITLATIAMARAIPVPIPLGAGLPMPIVGIPLSNLNLWYLRRNEGWIQIRRANFATTLSAYLSDEPELAAKIARQEPNYSYINMPSIISEYNTLRSRK